MSFLDDWFGGSSKKRVTEQEYKKARGELYMEGFSEKQRNKVDEIFKPDFYEQATSAHPRGLEAGEIDARIKWLRENKSKHSFSDKQIDEIESSLKKRL